MSDREEGVVGGRGREEAGGREGKREREKKNEAGKSHVAGATTEDINQRAHCAQG